VEAARLNGIDLARFYEILMIGSPIFEGQVSNLSLKARRMYEQQQMTG
jgi:hypothetical protein